MALDSNNARFLLWLRTNGVTFGDVLTIGRLGVFLSPDILEADAARFGLAASCNNEWRNVATENFCEPALMAMEARSVRSLDFSAYEGAELLHDLNCPLPAELYESCDLLFDSGSLEHVFNVPVALESYIQLVRPGGRIVLDMPCSGCCGHGFYQFSPELFFSFFSSARGCCVEAIIGVYNEPLSEWFLIPNPAEIGQRVEIHSSKPVHLLIAVKRLETSTLSPSNPPAQSDYTAAWNEESPDRGHCSIPAQRTIWLRVSNAIRMVLRNLSPSIYWKNSVVRNESRRLRKFTLGRSSLFQQIDPFSWRLPFD